MRIYACNEMFEGWPLERALACVREMGYEGVEIAPFTLGDHPARITKGRREAIRLAAKNRGATIFGLHWLLLKPEGLSINSKQDSVREKTRSVMLDLIDLCADLGGTAMVLGSPKQRSYSAEDTFEGAWGRTLEFIRSLCPTLAQRNVMLLWEPLTPPETNFINTAAEAMRLVDAVGDAQFGLMLDTRAMAGSERRPIPEVLRYAREYVKHIHVSDPNQLGPGMGSLEFGPILKTLREIHYQGALSVEVFKFELGGEEIARRSMACLKKYLAHG